ncbi:holin [Enterococcus sp. DIV0800]|uniref:holin n=1 Tax=unclassified Enterococcus TaxID=2608891 RepID=UPI003D2FD18D
MDEILTHILATGISFAPIMMIITEGVKQTKLLDSRFLPIVSIILGTVLGIAMGYLFNQSMGEMAIGGLVAGGMACGLYDATNKYYDRSNQQKVDSDDQENNVR